MPKLFFARYSLLSGRTDLDKVEVLLQGLADEASADQLGFVYRFLDTEVLKYKNREFIAGHLVKYIRQEAEEVVNEETRQLDVEQVPNKVVGKARFLVYPSASMMLFCEVPRSISPQTFMTLAQRIFEANHQNFFTSFALSLITERYSFIEAVKRFKEIQKVMITLFPSNPNYDDRWKRIDERLRKNHISRYREIQENSVPKGSIRIDDETESKFLMSEDGYGTAKVTGLDKGGHRKTISTKNIEKGVYEDVSPVDERPTSLLDEVYTTLIDIVNRVKE